MQLLLEEIGALTFGAVEVLRDMDRIARRDQSFAGRGECDLGDPARIDLPAPVGRGNRCSDRHSGEAGGEQDHCCDHASPRSPNTSIAIGSHRQRRPT